MCLTTKFHIFCYDGANILISLSDINEEINLYQDIKLRQLNQIW